MPPDARSKTRRHQRFEKSLDEYLNSIGTAKRPFRTKPIPTRARVKGLPNGGLGPPDPQNMIYRNKRRTRKI